MSTCEELATIYSRIQQRVDKGCENYALVLKVLTARSELELKYASMLKDLIPAAYDDKDPLTSALMDELKAEVNHHVKFASDLKSKVVTPAATYNATMRDKQKVLMNRLRAEADTVRRALKDTENAQRELDLQKQRLQQQNTDNQQKKVQKAAVELQKKTQAEATIAMKQSSSAVPTIHREFSDFDATRLTKLQHAVHSFEQVKAQSTKDVKDGADVVIGKMNNFDGKDRSERYITRVFDTSTPTVTEEDPEIGAVAIADYRSEEPTDLQFVRGDRIRVLGQHASGWWEGEIGGTRGTFPRTFVMLPGEADQKNDQIGAVFLVTNDYKKTRGGDLNLLRGDLVYVDYVSKGRCSGTNLRDKKRGYFPLDVLEQRI